MFTKVLFFSNEGVGKTTFIERYCVGSDPRYKSTIGAHFFKLKQDVKLCGDTFSLTFWDIIERHSLKRILYRGAQGAIFMYDITNENSLNKFSDWTLDVRDYCGDIPIFLVGNKLDLEESRAVINKRILTLKESFGLLSLTEISVKTGENVENMFEKLISLMMNRTD
jgi:small GTP-binding protein